MNPDPPLGRLGRIKKPTTPPAKHAEDFKDAAPVPATVGPTSFYSSLRVKENVHKLRFSHSAKLVEAGDNQSIEFKTEPFSHFLVMPTGVQIPIDNVSSAIPMRAAVNTKLTRKGRLEERKARLDAKMKANEPLVVPTAPARKGAAPKKGKTAQEELDEEDFVDESLMEDPDDDG